MHFWYNLESKGSSPVKSLAGWMGSSLIHKGERGGDWWSVLADDSVRQRRQGGYLHGGRVLVLSWVPRRQLH